MASDSYFLHLEFCYPTVGIWAYSNERLLSWHTPEPTRRGTNLRWGRCPSRRRRWCTQEPDVWIIKTTWLDFGWKLGGEFVLFSIVRLDLNTRFGSSLDLDGFRINPPQSCKEKKKEGLELFSVRGNVLCISPTDQIPDDCTCSRAMSHNQ